MEYHLFGPRAYRDRALAPGAPAPPNLSPPEDPLTPLPDRRNKFASGFTLLEVLIAFVITGLALTTLFSLELTGLRATRSASRLEQAVSRANSHLALAVHADPLVAGDWRGDDGSGFEWHLSVAPIKSITVRPDYRPTTSMADNFAVTLYAIAVRITWLEDGPHEVRLDTEQIGSDTR
jgi:general secretion pathway protein I